jgi:HrpA-like RNA helicase
MPLLLSSANMTKPRHKTASSPSSSSQQQPQRRFPPLPLSVQPSSPHSLTSSSSSFPSSSSGRSSSRLQSDRVKLPIHASRQRIIDAVRQHDTVVLVGETGSGRRSIHRTPSHCLRSLRTDVLTTLPAALCCQARQLVSRHTTAPPLLRPPSLLREC